MTRWLIWIGCVLLWTAALELPGPKREDLPGEVIVTNWEIITKSGHVAAYALLAATASLLPLPVRYRALMMFCLVGHAWLTEWLQAALTEICYRGGSLADVGLDILGIALGVAARWRWWTGNE